MVFNVVIRSTRQELCNFRPPVSELLVGIYDQHILVFCPFVLFYVRVQVIVPSKKSQHSKNTLPFSTLLSNTTRKSRGDLTPILGPVSFDHCDQSLVLFISPRPFDHCRIKHLLPSMQALHIRSAVEKRGNSFPVLRLH